jgi:hypothetical protein
MTQFGRTLHELNTDILCANSAPAKGRVERSFGTLQDRLAKELRLAGVSTLEAANAYLPGFLERHNARFGKTPFDASDGHRPLPVDVGLPDVFAREERTVSNSLTLQYDKVTFILEPNEVTRHLARHRVLDAKLLEVAISGSIPLTGSSENPSRVRSTDGLALLNIASPDDQDDSDALVDQRSDAFYEGASPRRNRAVASTGLQP